MYTYLRIEELVQEGRELQWVATPFEGRHMPAETRALYTDWLARVREVLAGREQPASGWQESPDTGRDMVHCVEEVLAILLRLKGVSTEDYSLLVTTEPGSRHKRPEAMK